MGENPTRSDAPSTSAQPCPQCGLTIKVGLKSLSVGEWKSNQLQVTNPNLYPSIDLSCRPVVEERWSSSASLRADSGVAADSSLCRHASDGKRKENDGFPRRDRNCRERASPASEASEYVVLRRIVTVSPIDSIQEIVLAGTRLLGSAGGLGQAARQIQSLRFEELSCAREFIERTQHLYPDIAHDAMSI